MLPSTIKAEVKLTTNGGIALAARELAALAVSEPDAVGLVAALFVGRDRERDGRWILVDAADYQGRRGESVCAVRGALAATAKTQPWLDPVRRYVEEHWPAFLQAFVDAADRSHAELVAELDEHHRSGRLRDALPRDRVLAVEHLNTLNRLVERHGESDAGRIAQDLLAYLLAMAGYRKVTLNAVGVPDFVLEDCATAGRGDRITFSLTRDEAERIAELCRAAGDDRLARTVERGITTEADVGAYVSADEAQASLKSRTNAT
jgi:hypothetical protein